MNKSNKSAFALGSILLMAGIFAMVLDWLESSYASSLISFATVLITISVFRMINRNRVMKDERTQKVSAYAASYSWLITLVALTVIFWVQRFEVIALTVDLTIGVLMAVMILTMILARWYFHTRGDFR